MSGRIVVATARRTCMMCPSQWDVVSHEGVMYYVRYRWGHLTIHMGGVDGLCIVERQIGAEFDGSMRNAELAQATGDTFDWSRAAWLSGSPDFDDWPHPEGT